MAYLSIKQIDQIQDAMQAACNLMGGLKADTTTERLALMAAIGEIVAAKDAVASPGLREEAHDQYGSDEIEIDDEGAGTSEAEGGVWVQAWVWIAQEEEEDEDEIEYATYQDDVGKWHVEERNHDKPTGFVRGPFETEAEADEEQIRLERDA